MTTATLVSNRAMDDVAQPTRGLDELVDRLMAALQFGDDDGTAERSAARAIHEARRLRQAGDVDGALAVLSGVDMAKAETNQARWVFSEWRQLVKRRFGDRGPVLYSQGTGRAAALVPQGRRRDTGGRRGPGDALAARQGHLGTKPPGSPTPESLP